MVRLNKYVQEVLGLSRRNFVSMVSSGDVYLDGKLVESIGHEVSGGEKLQIKSANINRVIKLEDSLDIILFNKPVGYVCSKSDNHNHTIYELLPKEFQNYFYIGRLDKDSRGLLILTNNSSLVNKFQHPSNNIEKEYNIQIDREFAVSDFKKMKKGIMDEGELLTVKMLKFYHQKNKYFVKIILTEGKKRHIRRMLNALGYKIFDLVRVREGQFELGNLKERCRIRAKF